MRIFLVSMWEMNRSANDRSECRSRAIPSFSITSTLVAVTAVAVAMRVD